MSPELLFNPNSPPTCQSDCYALGMVIYEVSWLHLSQQPFIYPLPGSDWHPTVSSPQQLRSGGRSA